MTRPTIIIATALAIHLPNLLGYPAWFYDEGAYLTSSLDWLRTGHLTYYGHPFLPLAILALLFAVLNPASYLLPRMLMVVFSAINGLLLFRVTENFLPGRKQVALLTVLFYEVTPLSARYLRLTVVDNFMAMFLLLSIYLFFLRLGNSIPSGLAFGAALISKQTGLFFLPGFLVLFYLHRKTNLRYLAGWLVTAAILPLAWIVYGTTQVGFADLIQQQFDLTSLGGDRAVNAVSLILQRISTRDPFIFFGLAGIIWAAYRRRWILLALPAIYYLSFILLFLKISTVYLIPTLPFLSILAAIMLVELYNSIPRFSGWRSFRIGLFGAIIIALSLSSIFLVSTQTPSEAQQGALDYVGHLGSPRVIASATYLWLFRQNYPNVITYDRYSVPWALLNNTQVYLIVDPGDILTIYNIPQYRNAYGNSTLAHPLFNNNDYLVEVRVTIIH